MGIVGRLALVGAPGVDGAWRFEVRGRQSAWIVGDGHRHRIEGSITLDVAV